MGSILGGGRYDDLTGIFGLPNMSGVGISFGLDRIYDVLTELNLFPASALNTTSVLLIPFDEAAVSLALNYAKLLRLQNIKTEVYPDTKAKVAKKFGYADAKKIQYVALLGSTEIESGTVTIKDLFTGKQSSTTIDVFIKEFIQNDTTTSIDGFVDISE